MLFRSMNVEKWPGDIMGPDYHSESVVANRLKIDGSTITVSDRPGLGVDADWAAVERLKMP